MDVTEDGLLIPRAMLEISVLRREVQGENVQGEEFCTGGKCQDDECLLYLYCYDDNGKNVDASKFDYVYLIDACLKHGHITKGQALDLTLSMK